MILISGRWLTVTTGSCGIFSRVTRTNQINMTGNESKCVIDYKQKNKKNPPCKPIWPQGAELFSSKWNAKTNQINQINFQLARGELTEERLLFRLHLGLDEDQRGRNFRAALSTRPAHNVKRSTRTRFRAPLDTDRNFPGEREITGSTPMLYRPRPRVDSTWNRRVCNINNPRPLYSILLRAVIVFVFFSIHALSRRIRNSRRSTRVRRSMK